MDRFFEFFSFFLRAKSNTDSPEAHFFFGGGGLITPPPPPNLCTSLITCEQPLKDLGAKPQKMYAFNYR